MNHKIKVAVLFGGRSSEHEVSLRSAKNIVDVMDKELFEPVLIGIDKKGKWYYQAESMKIMNATDAKLVALQDTSTEITLSQNTDSHYISPSFEGSPITKIDVIFPVLHGMFGEDGAVQGLAKLANLPCVGPGILGSAVGMDKDIMKRILRDANIGVAPGVTIRRHKRELCNYVAIEKELGNELFIKPVNLGSSVGISFTTNEEEFNAGLDKAFEFDVKVLVESKVVGRELECAVLGNEDPLASIPGEVIPKSWYSYESKYLDESGAKLDIPAKLTEDEVKRIQKISIDTYEVLECCGMTRVDMFMKESGELIINEVNTLPGFTAISMYPGLWEYSGIPKKELVTKLINFAIEKHDQTNALRFSAEL